MAKPTEQMSQSERRKEARERRKRVRERTGPVDTNGVVLRQIIEPIRFPGVDSDMVAPILAPNRLAKDIDGRFPPRGLVEKLRAALGVHALCAHHSISVIYGDGTRARDDVAEAAGTSFRHLRRYGASHISELTLFETEDDLIAWAKSKYGHRPVGAQIANNCLRAAVELSAVTLLGKTYVRAQRIIAGWEEAQAILSKARDVAATAEAEQRAHDAIENAYGAVGYDLSIGQLIEIAIYADINPVVLWPQHITFFTELFELARFVGRVNAGVRADLPTNLHELTRLVVSGYETGDARDLVSKVACDHLNRAFPDNRLVAAIDAAERDGLVVSVGRGTRRIELVARPIVSPKLVGRWQHVVSALEAGFTYGVSLVERLFGKAR